MQAEAQEPGLAQTCFSIFEGGGAKGIAHLGALKALEEVGLTSLGTAGASAGAIIAALKAFGYSADELFTSGVDNILAKRGLTPVDLLGRRDWTSFVRLKRKPVAGAFARVPSTLRSRGLQVLSIIVPPLLPLIAFYIARKAGRPRLFSALWRVVDDFGFFSTEPARDILNDLLRSKLGMPSGSLVCFRDIDPVLRETCCRLKIITTNLESGCLELFDDKTPDVVVADAVAASFAIPLFFKPAKVRCIGNDASETTLAGPYVDGGLVSNLPIWVFSEDKKAIERAVDNRTLRPLPIVAFQLVGAADAARGERRNSFMALFDYVERVLRTGIFGGQSITETFVTHLTTIPLPAALGTLGFDCTGEQALADYTRGRETARRRLEATFRDNPTRRYELLARVINAAQQRSAAIRTDGRKVALRACLVRRLGGNRSFKVSASINMHDDADDDLVLDQKNPAAPVAFRDRDVTYVDARAPETDLAMTKYERALVPDRLAAIISVPIYSSIGAWSAAPALRSEPIGVLCLDGDLPLDQEYRDRDFIRMLAELAVEAAPYMVFEKETS